MNGTVLFVFPKETSGSPKIELLEVSKTNFCLARKKGISRNDTLSAHVCLAANCVFSADFMFHHRLAVKMRRRARSQLHTSCFQRKLLEISFGNIKKFPEVRKSNFWKYVFKSHQNFLCVHFYTRLYP